jgi:hypothetical protein
MIPHVSPPTRPEPTPDDTTASTLQGFVVTFGSGLGAGALAAVGAALPGALRVKDGLPGGPSLVALWIALSGVALIPMLVAAAVLRRARPGVRAFAGPDGAARLFGLLVWLALLFATLSVLARALASAHNQALSGVTFALLGAAAALVLALLCARLTRIVAGQERTTRAILVGAAVVAFGAMIALAGGVAAAFTSGPARSGSATFIDALAFLLAAALAARPASITRRALAVLGPPLAAALLSVAMYELRTEPHAEEVMTERAPLYAPAAHVLSGH